MKHGKIGPMRISDPGRIRGTEGKKEPARIERIHYDAGHAMRTGIEDPAALANAMPGVNWVRLTGMRDADTVGKVGAVFHLDEMVLEDIAHLGHRTKVDFYEDYTFFVFNILYYASAHHPVREQISVLLAGNTVVTFQERDSELFAPVLTRILEDKGIIRKHNADFLLYCLIDVIVDEQFELLQDFEEKMDRIEADIVGETHRGQASGIYTLKRELLAIRNSIWPLRDVIDALTSGEREPERYLRRHYRDLTDHIKQLMDYTTVYRELVMGMYETYLSNINNRMNRIMTTLTVFSVIFIPLTFLSGVYGMNFHFFPELNWKWAYPAFWLVCIAIAAGMIVFFKKKKWL